ncbi:MAG TPA: BT_3928 family protein [Paludibacteraceae bacterium]|nr:BT_3928 family protein [Paludibacteraceae bacterium]
MDKLKPQHLKNNWLQLLGLVSRIVFGLTFIFSGFVKAIDPLGFAYKQQDYLEVWNLSHLGNLALIAAITLAAVEFMIGINLLLGIRLRETAWGGFLFMIIMTPLTLWIALKNPVSDCGCFGDALIIGNWATFWKNMVLLALIITILISHRKYREYLSPLPSWLLAVSFGVIPVAFSCYCLHYLPIIDFRPYTIGANISEGMAIPADAESDQYETTFIYEKNGVEKGFTLENYPWQDTTWRFVDQTSVLIKKGFTPAIHDFSITTEDDEDITDRVLNDEGITYLLVMYDLEKTNTTHLAEIEQLYNQETAAGAKFYALTASYEGVIETFKTTHNAPYQFCCADPITLKTMVRANPGIVVLQKGTILNKYNSNSIQQYLKKN